jgi:hypothetical protein
VAAHEGISSLDKLEAVVRNPAIYRLAEVLPKREDGDVGRPREWPDYMPFLFDALISVFTSARKVEAELNHRYVWRMVQRLTKKMNPNDPSMWLPNQRYRRHHYEYFRNKYLTDPVILEAIQAKHREIAAEQAREIGLLDESEGDTFTHPSLDRLLYADGKVVTPLYRAKPGDTRVNRETGEIRQLRYEADADLHMEGTGEFAWGCKFVMTAVRSNDVHGRIILDVRWCPEKGGEAKTAMSAMRDIAPNTPGALGVIYDGAFRGVHHAELMRDLGWLSINKVQAREVIKRDNRVVKITDKMTHIEDKEVNGKTVRLFARGGAIGVVEFDHNGNKEFVELKRRRTMRRADKNGSYRWYNEYVMADGNKIVVRLDTTEQDKERKLNRSENVRQISQTDPDFKKLYGRRADAESINRQLEDSLWLGRAHSKGASRQSVNMLGYALYVNGLALFLHRKRAEHDPEANLPSAA